MMPRTAKHLDIPHNGQTLPQNLPHLPVSTPLTKPQRPKSKSLQPCRCSHEGCGKMFSKRSNLKAHMRVHSGVLPYPCNFPGCTKRFRWKSSLKPHIRVHLASGHLPALTSSSNTAVSSELPTNSQPLNYTPSSQQQQPAPAPATILNVQGILPVWSQKKMSGDRSPTAINASDALGTTDRTGQREETREKIESTPLYPPSKPSVARVLFQDSHEPQGLSDQGEIDLSSDSVLSSSATSYETDVVSFSLDSPMEERRDSSSDNNLTENLWKSDIQVIDPFEELSMVGDESKLELLSGLGRGTGISANSTEANPSDSQWMFSSGGTTISTADFTTSLNPLSL